MKVKVNKNSFRVRIIAAILVFALLSMGIQWAIRSVLELTSIQFAYVYQTAFLCALIFTVPIIIPQKKRDYKDIEHGSSTWGRKKDIQPLIDSDFKNNILLSKSERKSMNQWKTERNNHVLIAGGSGAGKSRYYVRPNIMQMNASYIVTDPKCELLPDTGHMLEKNGYNVRVFNTKDLKNSMRFNPLRYMKETADIPRLTNIIMENTNGNADNRQVEDFWTKAERLWLNAHIAYVMEELDESEQNLNSVITLLDQSEVKEDDEEFQSAVDILFSELEAKNQNSFSAKQYKKYKLAASKTAKSILVSIGVRLAAFDIPEVADIISDDEMELEKIGDEKTALFLVIPDKDRTFNFLVAILLATAFQILVNKADTLPGGKLPYPIRCILDEFPNIGRIPDFETLISTIRSREISLEPIIQNFNQLKAMYEKTYSTIESNCDSVVFLGGKGEETGKYVSNTLLGKATIDTTSSGGSGGKGSIGISNYNYNEQKTGRELLDATEVGRLNMKECIVSIRGLPPFKSKKFDLKAHPNYHQLAQADPANRYEFIRQTQKAEADSGENDTTYEKDIELIEIRIGEMN